MSTGPRFPRMVDGAPLDRWRLADTSVGEAIVDRRFRFLDADAVVAPGAWDARSMSQLWRFHLHYWDWSWHLLALGPTGTEAYALLLDDWRDSSPYGRGDAWAPYVVSLRLWTFCAQRTLIEDPALAVALDDLIVRDAAYLRANVEFDVGGNHLLKNLKALVGAAVHLDDAAMLRWAGARLARQLEVQVLPDGGHFERSPSYHAQVLGDLIDVRDLLAAAHESAIDGLDTSIDRMRSWLGAFVGPDGTTPVLNDGVALREEIQLLGVSARIDERVVVLADSGYVVVRARPSEIVVMDVGDPCPAELPAHAHADCLAIVAGDESGWVLVDAGTSEYGSGPWRRFERSTRAHNTVTVDGEDQTEVWGAFRAGRRARPTLLDVADRDGAVRIVAEHDGYRFLPGAPVHRRTLVVRPGALEVLDTVTGRGRHVVRSSLLVAPRSGVRSGPSAAAGTEDSTVDDAAVYSVRFGERRAAVRFVQEREGELPIELSWKVEL